MIYDVVNVLVYAAAATTVGLVVVWGLRERREAEWARGDTRRQAEIARELHRDTEGLDMRERDEIVVDARREAFQALAAQIGYDPALRVARDLGWIDIAENDGTELRVRFVRPEQTRHQSAIVIDSGSHSSDPAVGDVATEQEAAGTVSP